MTNLNQYVTFAAAQGALTLAPNLYAALLSLPQGFQPGIVDPAQVNTFMRQASVVTAMIGQFIADFNIANVDAKDDGNITNLENAFVSALAGNLNSLFGAGFIRTGLVDTGADNTIIANLTPVSPNPYIAPMLIILKKKAGTSNTGPVVASFDSGLTLPLNDNTNAPMAPGKIAGGSIYMIMFDGLNFRVLSTAATITNITTLTANSGEGIIVETSSKVSLNYPGLVHDSTPADVDLISRYKANTAHHVEMTWLEYKTKATSDLLLGKVSSFSQPIPGVYSIIVPTFARRMRYRLWGGGGGGGSAIGPFATGGGGGGGAEYREGITQVIVGGTVQPQDTLICTVGIGGRAGNPTKLNGGDGTASSIGSIVIANGGRGGKGGFDGGGFNGDFSGGIIGILNRFGQGGAGGTGGLGGDAIFPGSPGTSGAMLFNPPVVGLGGTGGASFCSGFADGHPVFGINGRAPGGGASGGAPNGGIAEPGGIGGDGRIDIWFES